MSVENKKGLFPTNPNYKGVGGERRRDDRTGRDDVTEIIALAAAKKLIEKHNYEAFTDELTGCYNRKAWEKFKKGFDPEREGNSTQFVFVDLNNLREINNTKGHQAGDSALKRVVECLNNEMRRGDVIYRLGGDEFGIVCRNNSEVFDTEVFQHSLIERMEYIVSENPAADFAFGVAGFDKAQDKTLDDTMERADKLMYNNKAETKGKTLDNKEKQEQKNL